MDDKGSSGAKTRCNLKKVQSHWFLEVSGRLHRLSVLKEASSVYMEDNVIFADESVYQLQVTDSNEVNMVKIEEIHVSQSSNERLSVDDSRNNISQDNGQMSIERLAEEEDNERLAEEDDNIRLAEKEDDNLRLAEEDDNERLADEDTKERLAEENDNERLAEEENEGSVEENDNRRLAVEDKNDSASNASVDTDDIDDMSDYFDESIEFGNEEYVFEEGEFDVDSQLQKGSEEVVTAEPTLCKSVKVTALYDFKASLDDEISFKAGEVFVTDPPIFCDSNIWLKATHQVSGQTGFIPRNYVTEDFKSFYLDDWWHHLSREETEEELMSPQITSGTFVIRDSSDKMSLVLSVKSLQTTTEAFQIFHYKIEEKDGGFYIEEHKRFPDMSRLLQFYRSRLVNGFCCKLEEQLTKNTPDVPFRELELRRTSLAFRGFLCRGMRKGKWGNRTVIIQQYKQSLINFFISEISILKQLNHKNVIGLLAVYTKEEPFLTIYEMMKNGPLGTYLRQDEGKTLHISDLLDMTLQIAEGMAYLCSKDLIHRDLKADNVFVNNGNKVKIAGFRLARWLRNGVYKPEGGERVPIKWTAIERFNEGIYTNQSDVWSFGVLLYEVITFGTIPYPGIGNDETVRMIKEGYRMKKPEDGPLSCPQECYDIMLKCWDTVPENRPTFNDIIIELCKSNSQIEKENQFKIGKSDIPDMDVHGKKDAKKECVCM